MSRTLIFIPIFLVSIAYLGYNLNRFFKILKLAKAEDCTDNLQARFKKTLQVAFAQSKILREKIGGAAHFSIFWGFIVLMFSALEAMIQGFYSDFSWHFLGGLHKVIASLTDIFIGLILIAIVISLIRRFVIRIPRLQGDKSETKDAVLVLSSISTIILSLLVFNAATIAESGTVALWQPFSSFIAKYINSTDAFSISEAAWWVHILTILAFMNYLPFSKHFHVFTAIPNVFFSSIGFKNKLEPIDFEEEGVEKFGVTDFEDLSWKTIHSAYSCTHCGRCTAVCPANLTGKELSPREIMVQIRNRAEEKGGVIVDKKAGDECDEIKAKKLIGDYESSKALWQCTSCGACMQECPISIEHVPAIIGMRRSQVMMEADFPAELQAMFENLENNFSPWAFSPEDRAAWAAESDVKLCRDSDDFDILFWVGCAGSYDDNAKRTSRAMVEIMNHAGVKFAILGDEEKCNGDIARRSGNEYLADTLIKMNVETMKGYGVKRIVTACPHCYNTFKNEYPDFGFAVEVVHHTQFINELIQQGKIKINEQTKFNLTYHDSCYLSRYNNEVSAPREVLAQVNQNCINEVARSKDRSFCCGAGAGQMFMEEREGERVNIARTKELLSTKCDTIASNCPFCMTMLNDGVKELDRADEVRVVDIAEIVLQSMKSR